MNKREEINGAMKDALRNQDKIQLGTVRLIMAALKDKDIAARGKGPAEGISEAEILSLLQSMIKQRRESAAMYKDAGRTDLLDQEEAEIVVIERFLPKQMDEAEMSAAIESLITETGASGIKDMGKVMAELKSRFAGQLDMGKAGAVIKTKLSA